MPIFEGAIPDPSPGETVAPGAVVDGMGLFGSRPISALPPGGATPPVRDVIRDGRVVGQLKIFGSTRLFEATPDLAPNLEVCRQIACEERAVLVTGPDVPFNHKAAAMALGRVADWIRKEAACGSSQEKAAS